MLGWNWTPEEEKAIRRAIRKANAWFACRYPRPEKKKAKPLEPKNAKETWVGYKEAIKRMPRLPSTDFCRFHGIRVKKEQRAGYEVYLFNEQDIEKYEALHNDI